MKHSKAWQKAIAPKTTNELKEAIVGYLIGRGHYAWRQNNIAVRGRVFVGKKGVPDVIAVHRAHGQAIFVEVKWGKDKQSPAQKEFQNEVSVKRQAIYIIAHSLKDVTDVL